MFVYMCGVCTHLCAGAHAHAHVWKPEEGFGCSDGHDPPYFLEAGYPIQTRAKPAVIKPKLPSGHCPSNNSISTLGLSV